MNAVGRAESAPVTFQVPTPEPPLLNRFSSAAGDPTCLVVEWEAVGPAAAATQAEFCADTYPITDGMTYTARVFALLGGAELASDPLEFTVDFDPVDDANGVWNGEWSNSFGIPSEITLEMVDTDGVISGTWAMASAGGYAGSESLSGTRTGGHLELSLENGDWDPPLSGDFIGPDLIEASVNFGLAMESMVLRRQ